MLVQAVTESSKVSTEIPGDLFKNRVGRKPCAHMQESTLEGIGSVG